MARQETITRTIYQFDELSDAAKETAREWFRGCEPWGWQSEWWDSAKAFGKIAPVEITSADYDRADVDTRWTGNGINFESEDGTRELSGVRAWKWLQNNNWFQWARDNKQGACSMTGFCGDCAFADPIAAYEATPSRVPDLEQVFREACYSWVQEARDDMESSYSDESVDDTIRANEYEFDESGNIA